MDLTVSRPIKILVLVLVIAGVGGVASLQVLGKSSAADGSASELSVAQIRARAHKPATPAVAAKHKTAPAAAKPHAQTAKPVTTPAKAKPAVTPPKPRPLVAANGLPTILADALKAHRVVVVSIFDPQSQTDAVSYAEARSGAADADAGFLGVSVLDDTVAGPLTAALPGGGLLPVPGLLVYRAPGTLVQRIDGFVDRDAVAQLAFSGRKAPALATPAAPVAAAPTAPTLP